MLGAGQVGSHLHSFPGMWEPLPHWAHREAFVSSSPTAKNVQAVSELQFLCPNFFIKITRAANVISAEYLQKPADENITLIFS